MNGYKVYYEHCFTRSSLHRAGTNTYEFKFPDYWTNFNGQRALALRRLLIQPSARDISVSNMYLKKTGAGLNQNIGFNISLALGDDMNVFNDKLVQQIKLMTDEYSDEHTDNVFGTRDFEVKYNYSNGQLIFNILTVDTSDPYYFSFSDGFETSADLKAIIDLSSDDVFKVITKYMNGTMTESEYNVAMLSYPTVSVMFYTGTTLPQTIVFDNVWSRSSLFIASSLSTMAESQFLAMSNEKYSPPKYYDFKSSSNTFVIQLYDLNQESPIELPADGKDRIIIEMILVAR